MLKETMTYTDFNGNTRTEDFYFNLTKAELLEMELSVSGGFTAMLQKLAAEQDQPTIMKIMKDWILKAYGEKSPDGKRFIKSEELSTAFAQTEAYSQLYVRLATNAEEAAKFMNGVVPSEISEKIDTQAVLASVNQ